MRTRLNAPAKPAICLYTVSVGSTGNRTVVTTRSDMAQTYVRQWLDWVSRGLSNNGTEQCINTQ